MGKSSSWRWSSAGTIHSIQYLIVCWQVPFPSAGLPWSSRLARCCRAMTLEPLTNAVAVSSKPSHAGFMHFVHSTLPPQWSQYEVDMNYPIGGRLLRHCSELAWCCWVSTNVTRRYNMKQYLRKINLHSKLVTRHCWYNFSLSVRLIVCFTVCNYSNTKQNADPHWDWDKILKARFDLTTCIWKGNDWNGFFKETEIQ